MRKFLIGILLIGLIIGTVAYLLTRPPSYPLIVKIYRYRYNQMNTEEYKQDLLNYCGDWKYFTKTMHYRELLTILRLHLNYSADSLEEPRPEMPIKILERGVGRCGEFSLAYNGLLLACGYKTRLVCDTSILLNKSRESAGDHVWVEVLDGDSWIHIDPTEDIINEPMMYVKRWNKDINQIYAITEKEIIDVTENYK